MFQGISPAPDILLDHRKGVPSTTNFVLIPLQGSNRPWGRDSSRQQGENVLEGREVVDTGVEEPEEWRDI